MTILAHISDLHFGTEDPVIAAGLVEELQALAPTLVVVSGDLTQRAREGQFSAARDYLRRLPQPQLIVPGNHDVPLYDVVRRFVAPLARYRRLIHPEVNPVWHGDDVLAVGLNTARSLTWQDGRISHEQIDGLRQSLVSERARWRVVVTHHPFIPPPGPANARIKLVGRAARALAVLDTAQADLLLAGHLHEGYSGITQPYYPTARRALVAVQAGTAISRRVRQQANGYNVLRLDGDTVEITVRTWRDARFQTAAQARYQRRDDSWQAA